MKEIKFFMMGLFLALLLAGCEKEPINDPNPTIYVTVFPETVPMGGSTILKWSTLGAADVTINGVSVSLNDSMVMENLRRDTTLLAVAYSKDGEKKDEKIVKISVLSSIPSPSLKVTSNPGIIPYNGVSVISVTSMYADRIESDLPGFSGALDATFQTDKLKSTVTYHFKAIGKGGVVIDSITIEVLPITDEQLLCLAPWKMIKSEMAYSENGPWVDFVDLSELCIADNLFIFNEDYTSILDQGLNFCEGVTFRYFYSNWYISNGLFCGGRKFIQLDKEKLIWVYESIEIDPDSMTSIPIWVRETLIHP